MQNKMLKIRVKVQVIRNQGNMSTGSELFALLGSGFAQILGQIIFKRVKALRNTNTGADLGGGCPPPLRLLVLIATQNCYFRPRGSCFTK